MSTRREQITLKAIEILKANPLGVRYSELIRRIQQEFPTIPVNTIHGTVWNLDMRLQNAVYKPARGLWRHTSFRETHVGEGKQVIPPVELRVSEEEFYRPFADWLVKELEESTKAIALGGNRFKDKWGTPDVIGIRVPRQIDLVRPPTAIVTAEIKSDAKDSITAFG